MQRVLACVACIVLSVALQTVIFPVAGPLPYWRAQLAFVALVPWFCILLQVCRTRRGVLHSTLWSYLCGVLWYAGHCYWIFGTMHRYGHLSPVAAGLALLLFCLYLGLYHGVYGWLAAMLLRWCPKSSHYRLPFLLAALWVTVELARARITSFPWDLLGYSQIDNAALVRLAPVTGIYAIGFVVASINAIIAVGLAGPSLRRKNYHVELTSGVVLAGVCVLLGLAVRAPLPAATTNAILVQPNLSGEDDADTEPRSFARPVPLERQLATLSSEVAQRTSGLPVRLVLWPEAPTSYEMHEPNLQTVLTNLAAEEHVTVIADANSVDSDPSVPRRYRIYNAAGLFTATGLHARYDKIHLVPFGEFMPYASLFSFASGLTQQVGLFDRGTRRFPLSDGQHRFGVFICYESIFPDEVRELALRGAEVFANLSDDGWYGDTSAPFQHSNMARMRAIENRRWLLRDTNTGITESIDPYGNVRGVAPRHQRLAVALPFAYRSDLTFYTRHGDIFAWLCAALTAFAIVAGAVGSNGTAEDRVLTS